MVSRIADMSVAEKTTVVSATDYHCWGKADSPDGTNNACRADNEGCCSGDTYISRVKSPQDVSCRLSEDRSQTHADTRPLKAYNLVAGALKLCSLLDCR